MKRIDRVIVKTGRGRDVVIPWPDREALLAELRDQPGTERIVDAFVGVGTSAPVELESDDVPALFGHLNGWADRVGLHELPAAVVQLRDRLDEELNDPAYQ